MTFLELSLSGGVFVLAIAAFRALALRRLPKGTFVALWWLAAARLLLPLELSSRFSVYTLLEALRPKAEALPAAPAPPMAPAAPPVLIVPTQPVTAPPAPTPFPVWTALWLSVGLLLAAWFLIRYVRWRRRFRESLPVGCPGLDTWFQLRRRVEVRVTDQIAAPLTYGLLRPVVLLPKSMDLADEEAVTCVLAHERAHIRRLDGLLKLALTAALCLHWFNPAAWLLYVLGNRDMELRCDEAAVLALGEDSRERYALALIRLAENKHVPLCGFAHRNGMEERIKAIMSVKKKSLLACAIALAMVLGITTAFATSAKPAEPDSQPWNGDMADRELYAEASAESAAQWGEILTPYEPFGLEWTFDDPDLDGNGLAMTWEGHEVSGIYDEKQGLWITEHTGNGTFGPDAVELYTVYEGEELTGLRLATEEEQREFTRSRNLSSDTQKTMALGDSVHYDSGHIYFTIPDSEKPWSIFIQGRILMEDGSGMSVHYLAAESENAEWVPRMTYSFEVADAAYDELTMDIKYGNAAYCYPLTLLLPEGKPLEAEPLPEGKAEIPEGAEMIWPVDSSQINNSFGDRTRPGGAGVVHHTGVDIGGMEQGAPIYAAGKGTVKESGFNAQEGNFLRIDHGNGQETFYAHCEKLLVETGDAVILGQTIATVGSTGQSTGPHLHFEVLVNGVAQDPEAMLKSGQPAAAPEPETKPEAEPEPESQPVPQAEPQPKPAAAEPESEPEPESEFTKNPVIMKAALEELVDGDFPRNSLGETYGNHFSASYLGYDPDLIAAISQEDGTEGYIESGLRLLSFNSEEEAIACDNWRREKKVGKVIVPLYNSEHEEIGTFMHGIGNGLYSGVITLEEFREAQAQGWPNSKGSTPLPEREPIFKTVEEVQEAVANGWVGDQYEGYYAE